MIHIDPFAPGDSPQHPANWRAASKSERDLQEDALANAYQWRRDHFSTTTEANQDVAPEELEDRQIRYDYLLSEYATAAEMDNDPFVPQPVLLRRSVWLDLEDVEIDEWKELFEQHSTDDERDPMWVDRPLPDLHELRARAQVTAASQAADTTPESTEEPQEQAAPDGAELPPAPRATALKEEWVEYALLRDPKLTADQANAMTIADLKAQYKPKAD